MDRHVSTDDLARPEDLSLAQASLWRLPTFKNLSISWDWRDGSGTSARTGQIRFGFSMKRLGIVSVMAVASLLLTGCTSQSTAVPKLGAVVSCGSIPLSPSNEGVEIPCLDGKSEIHFKQLKGPLILNVWGSWCAPCKEEIPIFRSFYSKAKTQINLLGVNVEEARRADAINFVVKNGMTWPNLIDPDGRTRGLFGMGVPVTWFIDSTGKVVHKKIGVLRSEEELRSLTSKYLNIIVG